jgi:putative ABC transport system permease protein
MSALGQVVRAGISRRRVAAAVTCLSAMVATAAAVSATALMIVSSQPFEHAFATQNGADLTATFDGTRATAARLAATAHASGVSAAAGPFSDVTLNGQATWQGDELGLPTLNVIGRSSPGGPVDDVSLISGHWVTGPGQIVLATDQAGGLSVGATIRFTDSPGAPSLALVGVAQSVTDSADAWVTPAEAAALKPTGAGAVYQMLYRFTQAGTNSQILAGQAAVTATLPPGSLVGSTNYLTAQLQAAGNTAPFVPFILAFGVLGLATAILIIINVVSGAVGAALHKIGVLKALGGTPGQVVRAYAMIAMLPGAIGVVLGVVLGNIIATPLLRNAEVAYNTGSLNVAGWTDVAVPAAALVMVAACAVVPALRAGRMSANAALAVGRAPRPGRGRFARRFLAGLPIPQQVGLGLGTPLTRPARFLSIALALAFGAMTLTFAIGLVASLNDVNNGIRQPNRTGDVNVLLNVPSGGESAGAGQVHIKIGPSTAPVSTATAAAVEAAVTRQSGTAGYVGDSQQQIGVLGKASSVQAFLYQGATTSPYQIISGHWYTGPDQVLVPTGFLQSTGTSVGDTITLVDSAGERVPVTIVGEVLYLSNTGMDVIADASTFPGTEPTHLAVTLKPGTDEIAYTQNLSTALNPLGAVAFGNPQRETNPTILAMDSLAFVLTLLVVGVAGLGVFNTVMLEVRDRTRELGIYKAVGMTPQQTVAMVMSAVVALGIVAGVVGVPAGIALHDFVIPVMGHAAGTDLPSADIHVFSLVEEILLGLAGAALAVIAAAAPAGWAARLRTATALRTE